MSKTTVDVETSEDGTELRVIIKSTDELTYGTVSHAFVEILERMERGEGQPQQDERK